MDCLWAGQARICGGKSHWKSADKGLGRSEALKGLSVVPVYFEGLQDFGRTRGQRQTTPEVCQGATGKPKDGSVEGKQSFTER